MGNSSLSFRFAVFLSFSLTASSASQFFFKSKSQFPSPSILKTTSADLLSVLGPSNQSSKVNPLVSCELRSCLKFLVSFIPFNHNSHYQHSHLRRRLTSQRILLVSGRREENELIWWPPQPVLELARLAVDCGGDPTQYIELWILLFSLFHAKEYLAYDKEVFPYNMGYCQTGSNVIYDDSMNLQNILWLASFPSNSSKAWLAPGVLVVLDAHPSGIIYRDLIPEYVNFARTIYEDNFGDIVADVNYLNVGEGFFNYQIFIC